MATLADWYSKFRRQSMVTVQERIADDIDWSKRELYRLRNIDDQTKANIRLHERRIRRLEKERTAYDEGNRPT